MRYDETFRQETALRDGTPVVLRMVRAADKDLLRRGFDQLSMESRYRRFLGGKRSLSDQELRYLTEVDGVDHVAMGAVLEGEDGEEGIAIARFVRDEDDPEVAEPAVAVVDRHQGQGLGTLLLEHLTAAAAERGIRRFRCQCLASNEPVQHVLRDISPKVRFTEGERGVLEVSMPIPIAGDEGGESEEEGPPSLRGGAIHRFFTEIAKEVVEVPLGRRLLARLRGEGDEH